MRCGLFSGLAVPGARLFLHSSACVPWNSVIPEVPGLCLSSFPDTQCLWTLPLLLGRTFQVGGRICHPPTLTLHLAHCPGVNPPAGFKADSNLLLHFPSAPARSPIVPNPPSLCPGLIRVYTPPFSVCVCPPLPGLQPTSFPPLLNSALQPLTCSAPLAQAPVSSHKP